MDKSGEVECPGADLTALRLRLGHAASADIDRRKQETLMARNQGREQNPGKGKNLGQGLAGITDQDRRDLAPSGDKAPTKDQADRLTSGEQGQEQSKTPGRGDRPRRH